LPVIFIIISIVILAVACFGWFQQKEANNLLNLTTHKDRGNPSELALVKALLKKGIHPDAIFHDIYLRKRNGTFSQIDVVVATAVGLIVIEVKDYSGWIFGSADNQNWTQVLAYGREKYRMYNPVIQNRKHIEALRKLSPQFATIPMFNVVVFYGECEIKELSNLPREARVIYSNQIHEVIDHITQNYPKAQYSNKREIVSELSKAKINGDIAEVKESHIENVTAYVGNKSSRITPQYEINPIPRSVRKTLRWLRNLR
jgi:hypothetical protein